LVVKAATRPRYTLAELLAASDYSQPRSDEEQDWVNGGSVGGEII
jgi:antitoxin ChpS